jgi:glutamate transport system substrate-binding protein
MTYMTRRTLLASVSLTLIAAACGSSKAADTTATTVKASASTAAGAATTAAPAATTAAGAATTAAPVKTTAAGAATTAAPAMSGESTVAKIKAKGKIVIGTKFDQPLFGLKNPTTNEVDGFDAEVGRLLAKKIFGDDIKGKVEFVETTSKVREEAIEQGKVDLVIATYTINAARKERVGFAGPYYTAGQDLLVKKGDTTITGVDSLDGKKVCSVQGSTSLKNLAEKAPKADASITFDKYSLCVEALLDGRVNAVTTDNIILLGFVADNADKVQLVGKPFTSEPYGIGVKKDDKDFRGWVNDQLEAMAKDGSYAKAWDATAGKTGEKAPTPPAVDRY